MTPTRVLVAAALALAVSCAPRGPQIDADTIVLVTANSCASPRVGELLDDALSVTDVCGAVSIASVRAERATPDAIADVVDWLDGRPRAVIAVVGDRSLLAHVDPAAPRAAARDGYVSRHVAHDELLADTAALRARGVLVATAPLGRPGRVEIPELVAAADTLRDAGLVDVDLGATFAAAGDARVLTERGYDVLDTFGEQLVVRALFDAIVRDDLVPPRDDAERAARREARALDAWLHRHDGWEQAVAAAVDDVAPPPTPRHAARRAALRTARDGWRAGAAYETLGADVPDAPGLAIALVLARRPPSGASPSDPVEAGLLAALSDLPNAPERLAALTSAHPQRLDAWLGRQLVELATRHPARLRGRALRALDAHPDGAPPRGAALALSTPWPGVAASVLPALVAAQRPFARHVPSGPWLDDARRRARLGYADAAVQRLRLALERHRDLHPIARDTLSALESH